MKAKKRKDNQKQQTRRVIDGGASASSKSPQHKLPQSPNGSRANQNSQILKKKKQTKKNLTKTNWLRILSILFVVVTLLFLIAIVPPYLVLNFTRHFKYDCMPETCYGLPAPQAINITSHTPLGQPLKLAGWWMPAIAKHRPGSISMAAIQHRFGIQTLPLHNSTNTAATIIIVHGHGSNLGRVHGTLETIIGKAMVPLWAAGFNVLAVDLRNHGLSDDSKPVSLGLHESEDVLAAVRWLRDNSERLQIDKERIGIWGESMGGATSLFACEKDSTNKHIKAVISDASFTNARKAISYRMDRFRIPGWYQRVFWFWMGVLSPVDMDAIDVERAIRSTTVPVLIVHGQRDVIVDFNDGVQLVETGLESMKTLGRPPKVEHFWHTGGHVTSFKHSKMFATMVNFFQEHV